VRGIVQGVFFRVRTKEQAEKLGITGIVQNLEDGTVYIEAEGIKEVLGEFVMWCHEGPQHAHVERVEVKDGELKHFTSFQIVR
jgi:acylphosphatase